jgi:hypothetical protein
MRPKDNCSRLVLDRIDRLVVIISIPIVQVAHKKLEGNVCSQLHIFISTDS